jgi:hypothetical protein
MRAAISKIAYDDHCGNDLSPPDGIVEDLKSDKKLFIPMKSKTKYNSDASSVAEAHSRNSINVTLHRKAGLRSGLD